MKRILYLGWIGFNNVGDELLWHQFKEKAEQYWGSDDIELVPSVPGVPYRQTEQYDAVILGGGSLLIPGYLDLLYNAVTHDKPVWVWGSGFDSMDKAERGALPRYSADSIRMLTEIASKALFFGVRGPWTYEILERSGVPMDRILISGDPGLLMTHERTSSRSNPTIGINWGTTYNKLYGHNEMYVEDELATAARSWIRQGYRIYIYSMWGPDRESSNRLAAKIGDTNQVVVESQILHEAELMKRIEDFALTVNFKLHANLISHAAGVPFLCLGYRLKCFDYMDSVDLGQYILSTDTPELEQQLHRGVRRIEVNRQAYLGKMKKYQEYYQQKIEAPFRESGWGF